MTPSSSPHGRSLLTWIGGGALAVAVLLTIPLKLLDDGSSVAGAVWAVQMATLLLGLVLVAAAVVRRVTRRRNAGAAA